MCRTSTDTGASSNSCPGSDSGSRTKTSSYASTNTCTSPGTNTSAKTNYPQGGASSLAANSANVKGGAQYWVDEVTKRTNGLVKFQTFWGGTLVQKGEELNATQKGIIDVGIIVTTYFPDELPLLGWDYAFMFSPTDPDIAGKLATKVMEHPAVRNGVEKYGLKVLGQVFLSSYSYNGTKPFKTADDLKGVKVGAIGTEMPKWVQAVGGVPVVMGAPARYMSMQTGVIGGNLLSTDSIYNYKLYEVGKYVTATELGSPIGSVLSINRDTFDKLPADVQKIMVDTGKEITAWNTQYVKAGYNAVLKKMEEGGATVYILPFEEKIKWANAVPNLPAEWAKKMDAKGLPGTELVNYYLNAAKELGYKWPREWKVE